MEQGLTHIYYGDGKGKTTAAFGLALRCAGWNGRAVIAQFLKAGESGEVAAARRLGIPVLRGKSLGKFTFQMDQAELALTAGECLALLGRAGAEAAEADLLVLDEVIDALDAGLLPEGALCALLDSRPAGLEVVLTGHSLPPCLEARADYITRFAKEQHPYDQGIPARRGIEY